MNQASEGHFTFHFANRPFQLNTENIEFAKMYAEKLEPYLKQVHSFVALTPHVKIDDNIYQSLTQGLINRFDDLVNSVGKIEAKQFSLILNDVAVNFQKAAMIGVSRLQTDWEIVCKIAFKDNKIPHNSCRLTSITLMNADPHNNGQVPWRCEISNEQTNEKRSIFYKPSPVVIDMLLHGNTELLHKLNISKVICGKYHVASISPSFAELTHNATHAANLSSYIIVPMKDRELADPTKLFNQYGYMEFLVADDKSKLNEYNLEHHRLYSFQAGKVAAAALVCGMPDLHFDNLLICNERSKQIDGPIYVIDSENSLMPAIPDPNLTQLFRSGLGGFYGDYQDKPNRFLYRSNNRIEMYYILDAFFNGDMNGEYLKQISMDDGREDADKCKLYASLPKLMKMFSRHHASPPSDLYILRLDGNNDKVVNAIRNSQFNTTIVEAINYVDLWRRQNIDSNAKVLVVPNHHKNDAKQNTCNKPKA